MSITPPTIGTGAATAVIERCAPQQVVATAAGDGAGSLVLTDTWHPGWTATVYGRGERIKRADHAFRAVRLDPGRHEVASRCRPRSVRIGLALSALAALATPVPGRTPEGLGVRGAVRRRLTAIRPARKA